MTDHHEPSGALVSWIAREILPHERDLRSWLARTLPQQDVEDAVQETYCRLSGLTDISHVRNGRAYLFATGRRLVLERLRRARLVSIDHIAEIDSLPILTEEPSQERIAAGRQELERVRAFIAMLPDRCRTVFELCKIEGLSQREVAMRLAIPEHTVENEVAKGLKLILRAIADADVSAVTKNEEDGDGRARRRRIDQ